MLEQIVSRSTQLWDSGLYCAESVLQAMAEAQGINAEWIPAIATGFCGGVSDTGGMCGALSGAVMGIGLSKGRRIADESVDDSFERVQALVTSFEAQFGASSCLQLTGCDFRTEAGQRAFEENKVFLRCRQYVAGAARIASQLISETD